MEGDGRGRTPSPRMWRHGVALLVIPALLWQAAAGATAARGWPSRTDPEYGWTIAWDPTLWTESAPVVGQTADFALGSAERGSVVSFLATEAYAGTPDVCVAAAPGGIARSVPDAAAAAPLEPMRDAAGEQMVGRETGGAYAVYAVADGAREVVWTVRCRTLTIGRAELLVVHTVDRADYEAEAVRVAALLAGLALPLDAGPRPTPPFAFGPDGDNGYTDREYGWSIAWDPTVWDAGQTVGVNLSLADDASGVAFVAMADHAGDPAACYDAARFAFDHIAGIEDLAPVPDGAGPPAVAIADRVFTAYRYTHASTPGGEFAIAFDCRTLIPGEAVLLITHRVGLAEYAAEAARVADLLTGLEVSGEGAVDRGGRAID